MFCSKCGATVPEGAGFCRQCGNPIGERAAAPPAVVVAAAPAAVAGGPPPLRYAGFWLRFVAYLIDGVIISVVFFAVVLIVIFTTGVGATLRNIRPGEPPSVFFSGVLVLLILGGILFVIVAEWLYFAGMESSRTQGTLGKMALGLIVTDMECRPVTFGRATGRFFGKIVTGLVPFGIGYFMAGFTAKKQALHDMMASCLVLRKA